MHLLSLQALFTSGGCDKKIPHECERTSIENPDVNGKCKINFSCPDLGYTETHYMYRLLLYSPMQDICEIEF